MHNVYKEQSGRMMLIIDQMEPVEDLIESLCGDFGYDFVEQLKMMVYSME